MTHMLYRGAVCIGWVQQEHQGPRQGTGEVEGECAPTNALWEEPLRGGLRLTIDVAIGDLHSFPCLDCGERTTGVHK